LRLQIAFMRQLMAEGVGGRTDLVFLDMDVLVVDSLGEVRTVESTAISMAFPCWPCCNDLPERGAHC
jgi:hypothetical protein